MTYWHWCFCLPGHPDEGRGGGGREHQDDEETQAEEEERHLDANKIQRRLVSSNLWALNGHKGTFKKVRFKYEASLYLAPKVVTLGERIFFGGIMAQHTLQFALQADRFFRRYVPNIGT